MPEMIEVGKHYHVYDPKVITPTFQRARTRKEENVSDLAPPSWRWCPGGPNHDPSTI